MLYLLTPPDAHQAIPLKTLDAALAVGAVRWLQLRLKEAAPSEIIAMARTLQPLCARHNVTLILNDNPLLAAELGCGGVHVGSEDMPVAAARHAIGTAKILGASCYDSLDAAEKAAAAGADYLAFGAFYPSPTKQAKTRPALSILTAAKQRFPSKTIVAIGGITVDNAAVLLAHGADMLAATAGVWNHPEGAVAALKHFKTIMDRAAHENSR